MRPIAAAVVSRLKSATMPGCMEAPCREIVRHECRSADSHPGRRAPGLARARARLRGRSLVQAVLRVPARALAVGGGPRPRQGPGNAAGRQARCRHRVDRARRPLRDPAKVRRRPRLGHLLLGLSLQPRDQPRPALVGVPRPARGGRPEPRRGARRGGRARPGGRPAGGGAPAGAFGFQAPALSRHETPDFGYRRVAAEEKPGKVAGGFHSVAQRYDLMNDLMSVGLHRAWKAFTVGQAGVRPGMKVLDVAGGTADLAKAFARRVGPRGEVWLTDINA